MHKNYDTARVRIQTIQVQVLHTPPLITTALTIGPTVGLVHQALAETEISARPAAFNWALISGICFKKLGPRPFQGETSITECTVSPNIHP